jgi:hypothetical protein
LVVVSRRVLVLVIVAVPLLRTGVEMGSIHPERWRRS